MFRIQTISNDQPLLVDCSNVSIAKSYRGLQVNFAFEGFNYREFIKLLEDKIDSKEQMDFVVRYIPDAAVGEENVTDIEFYAINSVYVLGVSQHCLHSSCSVNVHLAEKLEI